MPLFLVNCRVLIERIGFVQNPYSANVAALRGMADRIEPHSAVVASIPDAIELHRRLTESMAGPIGLHCRVTESMDGPIELHRRLAESMAGPIEQYTGLTARIAALSEPRETRLPFSLPNVATPHMPNFADFAKTFREIREVLGEVKHFLLDSDDEEIVPEEPLYGNDGVKRTPGF
jgi:hypothetical protein